jgi:hypothetical protein
MIINVAMADRSFVATAVRIILRVCAVCARVWLAVILGFKWKAHSSPAAILGAGLRPEESLVQSLLQLLEYVLLGASQDNHFVCPYHNCIRDGIGYNPPDNCCYNADAIVF